MLPCSDSKVNKKCLLKLGKMQVFMDSFWTDFPCRLYELINVLIFLQYCTSLLGLMCDRCCFFCVKFQSKLGGEAQSTRGAQLTSLSCVHYRWR